MLGIPDALVAELLCILGEDHAGRQRLPHSLSLANCSQIQE